uniref:SFRICE_023708 n=1 Tax=Spodoptera frugiperda TaxID=7108 RepID=A0A2H1WDU7_SPOFR
MDVVIRIKIVCSVMYRGKRPQARIVRIVRIPYVIGTHCMLELLMMRSVRCGSVYAILVYEQTVHLMASNRRHPWTPKTPEALQVFLRPFAVGTFVERHNMMSGVVRRHRRNIVETFLCRTVNNVTTAASCVAEYCS